MKNTSVGFVGGGRIARIILTALQRKNGLPSRVIVSDPDANALAVLKEEFPNAGIVLSSDNIQAAGQDYVFLAVHPPMMKEVVSRIAAQISKKSFVISLAPVFRISDISNLLGGHTKVVRMIPNASTWINKGFNPITFSPEFSTLEKEELAGLLDVLGVSPEVDEEKLEAYAILSAMGPTYFWFQFDELLKLSSSFGLTEVESRTALKEMVIGAIETLFDSGLSYEEVANLIPVRPLHEHEVQFREAYESKLTRIYQKFSG